MNNNKAYFCVITYLLSNESFEVFLQKFRANQQINRTVAINPIAAIPPMKALQLLPPLPSKPVAKNNITLVS